MKKPRYKADGYTTVLILETQELECLTIAPQLTSSDKERRRAGRVRSLNADLSCLHQQEAGVVTRFRPLSALSLSVDEATATEPDAQCTNSVQFTRKFADRLTLRPSGVQRLTTQPNNSFTV